LKLCRIDHEIDLAGRAPRGARELKRSAGIREWRIRVAPHAGRVN